MSGTEQFVLTQHRNMRLDVRDMVAILLYKNVPNSLESDGTVLFSDDEMSG